MKLWRWCERGLAALGGMVLLATITPLPYWYASWLAGPWEDPKGETLIVLGASLEDRNLLALDSQRRARYAVMVWREGGRAPDCGERLGKSADARLPHLFRSARGSHPG